MHLPFIKDSLYTISTEPIRLTRYSYCSLLMSLCAPLSVQVWAAVGAKFTIPCRSCRGCGCVAVAVAVRMRVSARGRADVW